MNIKVSAQNNYFYRHRIKPALLNKILIRF